MPPHLSTLLSPTSEADLARAWRAGYLLPIDLGAGIDRQREPLTPGRDTYMGRWAAPMAPLVRIALGYDRPPAGASHKPEVRGLLLALSEAGWTPARVNGAYASRREATRRAIGAYCPERVVHGQRVMVAPEGRVPVARFLPVVVKVGKGRYVVRPSTPEYRSPDASERHNKETTR